MTNRPTTPLYAWTRARSRPDERMTSDTTSREKTWRTMSLSLGVLVGLTWVLLISALTGCQAQGNITEGGTAGGSIKRSNMSENDDQALLALGTNGPVLLEVNDVDNTLRLRTVSTGCTRAEHFSIKIDAAGNYTAERTQRDRCRRKAFVVTFEYPLDALPNQ